MMLRTFCGVLLLSLCAHAQTGTQAQPAAAPSAGILQQDQLQETVPATVFFAGKLATTQVRNSGGAQWADGKLTEFALVDNSGYSSGIRERYQFCLLTSVAIEFGGKRLEPGAYGGGFLNGKAVIMDLGARELLQAPGSHAAELTRPRPLQLTGEAGASGAFRLYLGRDYVVIRQLPSPRM